jgi:hypothetical protein
MAFSWRGVASMTKTVFGPYSRYRLESWITRAGTVQWAVLDAETPDPEFPGLLAIIRQADTVGEALAGFEVSRPDHLRILRHLGRAAQVAGYTKEWELMRDLVDGAMFSREALD